MSAFLNQVLDYALLAFGFGFVIFFHELGHFLAAKYCDVKVEQFAVGFGPAIFSWRKGLGFRWRTSAQEVEDLKQRDIEGVQKTDLGKISETEYRLNWVPLGGYVKMLGQDDLRPEATAEDPRAYNNKPIRSRMMIVSAGVIMNIILAALGFMVVFLNGWPTPAATVGSLLSHSPAMKTTLAGGTPAPLRPGDAIISFDGKPTRDDFTKIILGVALSDDGKTIAMQVRRHGPEYVKDVSTLPVETVFITPAHMDGDPKNFLALGIGQPFLLQGYTDVKNAKREMEDKEALELSDPDDLDIMPGDTVMEINGKDVRPQEIWKLYNALEQSDGKPVDLTIKTQSGSIEHRPVSPHFEPSFEGKDSLDFLGLVPRALVLALDPNSPARNMLKPGDVIISVTDPIHGDTLTDPDGSQIIDAVGGAGDRGAKVTMTVLSRGDAQPHEVKDLNPNVKLPNQPNHKHGLHIGIGYDDQHMVVANIRKDSVLDRDGKIRQHDVITAVNDNAVTNWFQFRRYLGEALVGEDVTIHFTRPGEAKPLSTTIKLTAAQIDSINMISVVPDSGIQFQTMTGDRKTSNPLVAIGWGTIETRDLILQFYLTLQRMVTGAVAVGNMMGPVGIFNAGHAFAEKGNTWLIWFLAMISANLAVVNFLPIPIVDGGLFTFLILEKIQGRPLSPNTQRIVQVVGLALILGVFLLVTYQDIARMAGQ